MFGFIKEVVEDVVDVSTAVVTLGECGKIDTANVCRLASTGLTIYEISQTTGIAVDIIEETLNG